MIEQYDGTQEFDFMDIRDDEDIDAIRSGKPEPEDEFPFEDSNPKKRGYDNNGEHWEMDDENFDPDDVAEEGKQEEARIEALHEALRDIAEDFDEIADDFEFTISGQKVSKADITDVVRTKAELKEAQDGIRAYVNNLSEVEMRVQTYLEASMTETEQRLRHVENLLAHPERMTGAEVQKALIAQRDLRNRQTALENNAKQVRAAEEERRQQIDLLKIRQTDAELRSRVPNYRGIETLREIVSWAQKEGIEESDLRTSMSPGLIRALMDAKLYREKVGGKASVREAAKARVSSAPKSMSSKPKSRLGKATSGTKRRTFEQAMAAGDMSAAFNLLED